MAIGDAPIKVGPAAVQIFKTPAMINPGVYQSQSRSTERASRSNQNGFSDHFPITMTVTELD